MQKWQYHITKVSELDVAVDPDPDALSVHEDDEAVPACVIQHMNQMGAAGWELVEAPSYHSFDADDEGMDHWQFYWKCPI